MTSPEQTGENKEFVPMTPEQLETFRGEFAGENKEHLRDAVSSLLGRQSIDSHYPQLSVEDPATYLQFVGQAAITESRLLDEVLAAGTVYNGTQMSLSGLDRYRLAKLEYLNVDQPEKDVS